MRIFLAFLAFAGPAFAQPAPQASAAPLPQPLLQAHTVFLAGYSSQLDEDLKEGPLSTYQTIYGTLQHWGRLKLVSSPQQADVCIVFDTMSASEFEYGLRIQITDCHSVVLWITRIKMGLGADSRFKRSLNSALDKWVKTQLDVLFPVAAPARPE
jgi:hypothetical protein